MSNRNDSRDITRREALARGLTGAAGLLLAGAPAAGAAADSPPKGKAKSVIQIWAAGGPPHLDTFDPKPDAGNDYCGPLNKPLSTNVDGIRICELLPMLAKQADKYSLIRSMTHGNNGHETAAYLTQTGRRPGDRLVYPCAGAVVSLFKGYDAGYRGLIPPYVVLTQTQGRFSEAGFLGPRYQPFATGGDPAQTFMVEGVSSQGLTDQQQQDRRDLLRKLDTLGATAQGNSALTAFYESEEQAYDMILGDGAKAFDLSQETAELRSRYGHRPWSDTALITFGQACLAARRLVERGVPYITINHGGWDTHTENFRAMQTKLPELDQGLATLLEDLAERGLLDTTVVWWCGEFGRTPKIDWQAPWNGGRGHYGKVFSAVVAGGGFKGGHVVGSSDAKGEEVKERPVYPCDLIGSIYELLGIDPDGPLPNPLGQALTVTPSAADGIPMAGRLKEIM
ncbi:MAG: DUF1501 domain-containing protein [Pirellulaceae bacterium]|nr:DUF1501 domain-containing protein [Pirellulaceae bacterium]